ncbi:MAG: toxin-antitoxin system HicB family antitoxin [Caulobacterales bacterium]
MDITHHVEALRQDLARAAEVGSEDVRGAVERLSVLLEPALRLTVMAVASETASEIAGQLEATTVDVVLQGRDRVEIVARTHASQAAPASESPAEESAETDGEASARITLRLPEALKVRAEALAAGRGQSLNTWLVNAARMFAGVEGWDQAGRGAPGRNRASNRRVQGWAR